MTCTKPCTWSVAALSCSEEYLPSEGIRTCRHMCERSRNCIGCRVTNQVRDKKNSQCCEAACPLHPAGFNLLHLFRTSSNDKSHTWHVRRLPAKTNISLTKRQARSDSLVDCILWFHGACSGLGSKGWGIHHYKSWCGTNGNLWIPRSSRTYLPPDATSMQSNAEAPILMLNKQVRHLQYLRESPGWWLIDTIHSDQPLTCHYRIGVCSLLAHHARSR